jgi:hypothetical protein
MVSVEKIFFDTPPKSIEEIFASPKLKVERAKRHISDYRAVHKTFTESGPISITPDVDPKTGNMMVRMIWVKPVPGDLHITVADALYNLRSALDQAASCCARAASQSAKETYFPHGVDKAGFESSMREKCKKVSEPARDAIAFLQPYYGGDGYLIRALHDLNLVDKHSDLIAVGAALRKVTIEQNVSAPAGKEIWQYREGKFELIEGVTKIDNDVQVTLSVTFTDVEAVRGQPVTKVLYEMTDLVSRTIDILEAAMIEWKRLNP